MKGLTLWATFALLMDPFALIADGCSGYNCATDEPIVSTPALDTCVGSDCATDEPTSPSRV